ncbi:DUF4198 domain-containing protein [Sutterella sp.]|uniref:DUF4198 domain-containing protein n=1 Tax=Sutterella sp. TaxID=1981025 RepID=UPI0026E069C3|nr:DUF4198 domain-containing protein [Sutterella sp.]MDO5530522.1 DUF4198 domain-containing protein [Sutterella sp.]
MISHARVLAALAVFLPLAVQAHFGIVIPDHATALERAESQVNLRIAFAHPMERSGMTMAKPVNFSVWADGAKTDLTGTLAADKLFGKDSWKTSYRLGRPGVYQFVAEPVPYWEPAEDKFIVHYTKTVVSAFGEEDGWAEPVGVRTEIVPLTRPFAAYAGNVFRGQVLLDGKPAANCEVEVEYFNEDGSRRAPNDYFVTQVVRTDAEGIFSYAAPWAGWWGFAALNDAPEKMKFEGAEKDVELGAVIWMEFTDPAEARK